MANEWVKVELYGANNDGNPVRFTVADSEAVSKGTLMALKDARAASAAVVDSLVYAGVASMEKLANDGSTSISCWTDGVFEVQASLAISLGHQITGAEDNMVLEVGSGAKTVEIDRARIIGRALEIASAKETINVRLKL